MIVRESPGSDFIGLLDRVLDKGAVVDKAALLRLDENTLRSMRTQVVLDSVPNGAMQHLRPRLASYQRHDHEK